MDTKFVKFEEVIKKLAISADRLNELREAGALRAYRDGSSWKFRADEIDRLAVEGLPDLPPPSDIGMASGLDLMESKTPPPAPADDLEDLQLMDDDDLSGDLRLADDTDSLDEPSDPSDSILLTEEALGGPTTQPPSTIIGRHDDLDADLQLVDDDLDAAMSDVRLVSSGASDVLSSGISGSGVLDDMAGETSRPDAFAGIEELELDLAAEASQILEQRDVAAAKDAASKVDLSDLALADDGDAAPDSDFELATVDNDGTDPVPATPVRGGGDSDLDLATADDDLMLADSGGSDITLDSADSGINLVSPADSGVALDNIPLDIGGSAILSSLALGALDSELSLVAGSSGDVPMSGLQADDDFQLTPLKEGRVDDEDSSSQVIALDADDPFGAADGGILGADDFAEDTAGVGEGFDGGGGLDVQYGGVIAARAAEGEFTTVNVVALACMSLLLLLCTIALLDMVRNIWSWNEPYALNSALLDSLCGLFGLRTK